MSGYTIKKRVTSSESTVDGTMSYINQRYFEPPLFQQSYLQARGFDSQGQRSGGITSPREVAVPAGTVLLRLYHETARKFGGWWFTGCEMQRVLVHFGRSGPALADGRPAGEGILHAVLAVRHDWAAANPKQLGRLVAARLRDPLRAFFGEADDAPNPSFAENLSAQRIVLADGTQRRVRQLFLPHLRDYRGALLDLGSHDTDCALNGAVERYRQAPLYFERGS
jgi:hypothetical protein